MGDTSSSGFDVSQERLLRAELNRLLESTAFRTSKRCREFLEYVVEHTINGPNGALKERSIGVDLFQLPPDFDTSQHTIVRVTANEVRKKLAQHYQSENGSYFPVRIGLLPGSYSAEFRWEAPVTDTPIPASPSVDSPIVEETPAHRTGTTLPVIVCAVAILAIAASLSLWRWRTGKTTSDSPSSSPAAGVVPNIPVASENLRLIAGSTAPYTGRDGRTWGSDRYFSGGAVTVRPAERIFRTLDPDIYRHIRHGDFRYDIPLKPGSYELHLHFAETGLADFISAESSGEGQRLFRVVANGKTILDYFDVVADADGTNIADERVFRNIAPGEDGFLHLSFSAVRSTAMVSGIEVLPVAAGKVKPIRIRAGWTAAWQDSSGQQWQSDSYFMGGNALMRTTNPARENDSVPTDMALYGSERWGHFSYALPVAEGRYRVTLKFCEGHYGRRNTGVGGVGSRVFDVYCNGVALLRNFDIVKEAGGEGRPLDRVFSGIRPTAQGKLLITFVPIVGMACVNGMEVVEDSR